MPTPDIVVARFTPDFRTGNAQADQQSMPCAEFLRPQCRLSEARQTIGLFLGPCPNADVRDSQLDAEPLRIYEICGGRADVKFSANFS